MGARVYVTSSVPQEAYQSDAGFFRGLYCEAGGRSYCGYYSDAGCGGLLDELEAGASAKNEDGICFRETIAQKAVADEFVEGIVTSDVFAEDDDLAGVIEESGGVEAARGIEDILARAEALGELEQEIGGDRREGLGCRGRMSGGGVREGLGSL